MHYPYFCHASRSRSELRECLQTGCLQGGKDELENGGESYSLNSFLRGAEKELVDVVNPFAELESAWEKYTAAVSMFLSLQYGI